jgi:hypothetical protein
LRIPRIVAVVIAGWIAGPAVATPPVPGAIVSSGYFAVSVADSTAVPPDSVRNLVVTDSLGIPGTLKGQTPAPDPAQVKETLQRMGSNEVAGSTEWERKKNPKVAMLCSALLPGLGQTYNGRRIKVGLMVGFTSFYYGNAWLNWRRYEASIQRRDTLDPDSAAYRNENARADFWKEEARTYLWWSGAVWLIGLLDSWIDAHLYDVREYTPPARPETSGLSGGLSPTSYVTLQFGVDF